MAQYVNCTYCGKTYLLAAGQKTVCDGCGQRVVSNEAPPPACPHCGVYVGVLEQICARPPYPVILKMASEALEQARRVK